jgi:acyl-CoA synthetase (AMP-forming)/AMP-acid ligase II
MIMVEEGKIKHHQQIRNEYDIGFVNIGEMFKDKVNRTPEKIFLICPGKTKDIFTYDMFDNNTRIVSSYLLNIGLKKGDRVNLIFPNSPEFLMLYFACLILGIVAVPINPDIAADEMRYIVEDCESKAVFYQALLELKVNDVKEVISSEVLFKCLNALPAFEPLGTESICDDSQLPRINYWDPAVIIYTSGTTGNPKGAVLSQLNLLADAKAISEWFHFSSETRTLCILPLFHNNGQITTFLAPLFAGGSTVIVKGKASLLSFWGLINEYEATWTSVMASILSILLSLKIEKSNHSLEGILCGGQILSRNVQDEFEDRFGIPIFEGYGLTETTSFSCINNYPAKFRKFGTIGKPLPTNEMAILNERGEHCAANTEGEICIRGLNVACEYLGLPKKNIESFAGGWFHSGDYGYMDKDGYFYFNGRKDSLIIKGGENIYPAELENVLFKHKAVSEAAVIGIPSKLLGQDICAFVRCHENMHISEKELKEYCKHKIAAYKQPLIVIIIDDLRDMDEIPKGPTKKILYRKLEEYYRKNEHHYQFGKK